MKIKLKCTHHTHKQKDKWLNIKQSCGDDSRNFREYYNPTKKTKRSLPQYRNSSDIVDRNIHEETEITIRDIITKANPEPNTVQNNNKVLHNNREITSDTNIPTK